ncbi:hypothetical protein ACFYO2_06875 [Streptomyces sp. NPDC006602]
MIAPGRIRLFCTGLGPADAPVLLLVYSLGRGRPGVVAVRADSVTNAAA